MVSGDDSLRDYGADDCREGALDIRIRRMCGLRQVSLHVDDCEGRERTNEMQGAGGLDRITGCRIQRLHLRVS